MFWFYPNNRHVKKNKQKIKTQKKTFQCVTKQYDSKYILKNKFSNQNDVDETKPYFHLSFSIWVHRKRKLSQHQTRMQVIHNVTDWVFELVIQRIQRNSKHIRLENSGIVFVLQRDRCSDGNSLWGKSLFFYQMQCRNEWMVQVGLKLIIQQIKCKFVKENYEKHVKGGQPVSTENGYYSCELLRTLCPHHSTTEICPLLKLV